MLFIQHVYFGRKKTLYANYYFFLRGLIKIRKHHYKTHHFIGAIRIIKEILSPKSGCPEQT